MSDSGLLTHSIGIAPEMISQPLIMLINATAIETTRIVVAPDMGFYDFAKLEDTDPVLRTLKSARQIAILAALTSVPGGQSALLTTGTISLTGVLGNRLLSVGTLANGSGKLVTLSDALLDIKVLNEWLDASFNSRVISSVTPLLLGTKLVSKLYDNLDTSNDTIVSVASGAKVNYANVFNDSAVVVRAIGHGLVVTGAMMDLFDISPGSKNSNYSALSELAKLHQLAAMRTSSAHNPEATVILPDKLRLPTTNKLSIQIGDDNSGQPISRFGNSRLRFYVNDLTTLINPSPELRAQGFCSSQVDQMLATKGETYTREFLKNATALTDYSTDSNNPQLPGSKGKIFLPSSLSASLRTDVELAVSQFVTETMPTISEEQYSQVLEWNIKRVERSIQIHETTHLRNNNSDEFLAWQMSNQFLAFDYDLGNGLPNIPLEFALNINSNSLHIVRKTNSNSLTPHLILLSSTENNPSAFSSLWSTQLYSHNHNQLALAAMNSEGQDPIINEQNLRNPIALNICIRNMLDRDKRLSQLQNDPNAIKAELREIGLDLNEDELHYIVKFVGRVNPMLALKIIYAIEFKDKQRLEMRVDEMVDRHLPTLLKDVNVFEIYEFIQVAVAALRKNSIEL